MTKPEKVKLVPDEWHIDGAGIRPDGNLIFSASQIAPDRDQPTRARDFFCTFTFDRDGNLIENKIELVGTRGEYTDDHMNELCDQHVELLSGFKEAPIWVRPFRVDSHGEVFGLVPVSPQELKEFDDDDDDEPSEDDWRVEFMPGNTLSFYPPWEEGGYDT